MKNQKQINIELVANKYLLEIIAFCRKTEIKPALLGNEYEVISLINRRDHTFQHFLRCRDMARMTVAGHSCRCFTRNIRYKTCVTTASSRPYWLGG